MSAATRLACAGARERARERARHARSAAVRRVLVAHFAGPLPDARALLERRAERKAEEHAEAMRGLGLVLSRPLAQPLTNGAAP